VDGSAAAVGRVIIRGSPTCDAIPFILDGLLLHAGSEALLEPTISALISFVFIDNTVPTEPTRVLMVLTHRTPEESLFESNSRQ